MFFVMSNSPELLYHIILTVIDYHVDPSGAKRSTYVLGTHATLEAAKNSTFRVLDTMRYEPEDFVEYAVHSSSTGEWGHGDGVLVYAKAPAGQVFLVSIQATPNDEKLPMDLNGGIFMPKGISSLHYVMQTTIDYNKDRTGCVQETQIEGTFIHRADAYAAARKLLDPLDYADYDTPEKMAGEWPFGEEVVAHAIAETGQNTIVEVKTVTGAHHKHGKGM
ncbi:uncharacterized protein B0J16DRAFT_351638 [Fusarium flagelliforme]|nr:uncharacterized protein B0J16DRAFT_351638 [Fusarium flagelliforme]KAH7169835.1 hypothetical protein B0J16DRAFT_351638 [Fusarium flagelliforme]